MARTRDYDRRARYWLCNRMPCCCRTAPATLRGSTTRWTRCAGCWKRVACPSSASAWATSCWRWRRAARTVKMRFGHRGVNQPVLETATGRMSVTTQNHGYMVDPASIPSDYIVTHTNLNDGSVEGIAHISRPVWGVQWHPEAAPRPRRQPRDDRPTPRLSGGRPCLKTPRSAKCSLSAQARS